MAILAMLVIFASGGLPLYAKAGPRQVAENALKAQRKGDFATAIKEYKILTRLEPGVPQVYSNLGVAYFFNKQPREAIEAFKKALRMDPNLLSALIFCGIADYNLSDTSGALYELKRAVLLSPTNALAQTWLAYSYLAASQLTAAVNHFKAATRLQPHNVDAWYGLGKAYVKLGQLEIHELARVAPNGARLWELAGDQYRMQGNLDQAVLCYRQALHRRPDLRDVRQSFKEVLSKQGKPAKVDLPPVVPQKSSKRQLSADQDYFRSKHYEQLAQKAFLKVERVAPDSYRAHQVLAESLVDHDRFREAIVQYLQILKLKPGLPGIHMEIGNVLMREGQVAQAVSQYQSELKIQPDSRDCLFRLGQAWLTLGNNKQAEVSLGRALALGSTIPVIHRDLGQIYLRQRKYSKSISALSAYLKASPQDATAHYLLMQDYNAIGDQAAANRQRLLFRKASADRKRRFQAGQALSLVEKQSASLH